MKKFYILLTVLAAACMPMLAEDLDERFVFVDANGNEIADGSTVTVTTGTDNGEGVHVMFSGVSVKNVSGGTSTYVKVNYTINQIDNGAFQICFPVTCNTRSAVGSYETSAGSLSDGEVRDIQSEWLAEAYGTCNVTLQLETQKKSGGFPPKYTHDGYGATITLNFVYGEEEPGVHGDVNGDGEVTVGDVNAIIDLILNGGDNPAADLNGDGEITVSDVNAVIDLILNGQ